MTETWWQRLLKMEPAVWRGVAVALLGLLATVGVVVSPDIPDAVLGFWVALGPILQAFWTKPAVTPNAKVAVYMPDPIEMPTVVKSGEADASDARDANILAAAKQ